MLSSSPADHPRIRGEHSACAARTICSPGIIPAYAGSTPARGSRPGARTDHPRIRGEHFDLLRVLDGLSGSSPHTRGARLGAGGPVRGGGIIPAYAGSTARTSSTVRNPADHPRIRGEHVDVAEQPDEGFGSSPHTRGALGCFYGEALHVRIIPAYAGSTGAAEACECHS